MLSINIRNLFRSQCLFDILRLFCASPEKEYFVREIAATLHTDLGSVQKNLVQLGDANLICFRVEGKRKYARLNTKSPHIQAVRDLFASIEKEAAPSRMAFSYEEYWISPLTISANALSWAHFATSQSFVRLPVGDTAIAFRDNGLRFAVTLDKVLPAHDAALDWVENGNTFDTYLRTFERIEKRMNASMKELCHIGDPLDKQFIQKIKKLHACAIELCVLGYVTVLPDFPEPSLSEKMRHIVQRRLALANSDLEAQAAIALFTSPDQLLPSQDRRRALLSLVIGLHAQGISSVDLQTCSFGVRRDIELYYFRYGWNDFGHFGDMFDIQSACNEVNAELARGSIEQLQRELGELTAAIANTRMKKESLMDAIECDSAERKLFQRASDIVWCKAVRLALLSGLNAQLRRLVDALEAKIGIERALLYQCSMNELCIIALHGADEVPSMQLRERSISCVWHIREGEDDPAIFFGEAEKDFIAKWTYEHTAQRLDPEVLSFHGSVAYSGDVQGRVRILNSPKDMDLFQEGEILVTHQTVPELLPTMKKAAAFVTNSGGITCHAAIVARELKKPCIVGTKVATQVLKDGDLVRVDANRGRVIILQRA